MPQPKRVENGFDRRPAPRAKHVVESMRRHLKLPGDDFYCWRFQVWYDSLDCAVRTLHRTAPGCRDCEQGLRNLALNRGDALRVPVPRITHGFADAIDIDPTEVVVEFPVAVKPSRR